MGTGASAQKLLSQDYLTIDEVKSIAGDRYNDELFRECAANESSFCLSSSTLMQLSSLNDIFLSHNWGVDVLGRNNHVRVAKINSALKSFGFLTWFDGGKKYCASLEKVP